MDGGKRDVQELKEGGVSRRRGSRCCEEARSTGFTQKIVANASMKVGWAAAAAGIEWAWGRSGSREQTAFQERRREKGTRLEGDWGWRKDIFKCRDVCEHIQKSGEHYSKAHVPNTQLHQ